jgi:CBS domain-containing protein
MTTVRDVMTTKVITFRPETPLHDVASQLIAARISGAPVVADDGTLLGVVSEADILIKEQGSEAIPHRRLAGLRGESAATKAALAKAAATNAGEAMTAPPITVREGASIAEAARIMTEHHVNRLPVVAKGALVGIVTRADLVGTFVRTDAELVEIIREEVLWRSMWVNPVGFDIRVEGGHVRIRGHVDRRSTADLIASVITMVPGVIDVRSDITFELDDQHLPATDVDLLSPFALR